MNRPNQPRDLKIRIATRHDAEAVAALAREHNFSRDEPAGAWTPTAIKRDFFGRARHGIILIAELDGQPAGYALLTPAYETRNAARGFELNELYVTDAARQRSIWPVMLSVAAMETKQRDGKFLRWITTAWNVPAQEFYRKQGASEVPVMSHALTDKQLDAAAADGAAFLKRVSNS